jgi:hypothetical protein
MRGFTFLVLAAVAGIGFTATAPKAEAQVSVEVGVAPDCPYGYYDVAPYAVLPLATTVRNGLTGTSSLAPARGFMALATSRAT